MKMPLLERIADGFSNEAPASLRVRIFRLVCALLFSLCLGVVGPLNLTQNLPLGVHLGNLFLGFFGAFCYWQSSRGRHLFVLFVLLVVGLLDYVWFLNAGSDGSVAQFFFPLLVLVVTLFEGRVRWVMGVGIWLNVLGLHLLEYFFPHWVVPFSSQMDRLVDAQTTYFCSFLALVAVVWFVLTNYNREQRRVAETAERLAASEVEYREIFNSTSDALFVHSADGSVLDVNEQACTLFGSDRATLLRSGVKDFSLNQSPYSQNEALIYLGRAMQGQAQIYQWRSKRANGELFWSEVALRVWAIGSEKRVIASVRDISQRIKDQDALRLSEERMRLAILSSNLSWFDVNLQTGETVTSQEYSRMLGYEAEELKTGLAMWQERIHPEDRPAVLRIFQQAVQSREIRTMEYRLGTKTGDWKWIRSVGKVVEHDTSGRPWRMLGTHMDIDEHKQVEAALFKNEARLRLAMEASHQGWFELNLQTGESLCSPEYVELLGHDPANFPSSMQAWIERIHPVDRATTLETLQQLAMGPGIGSVEYRQQTKSGGWKWFRSMAKVVEKDPAGKPRRIIGTHTDITDRKELETQLLHSQRLEAVGSLAAGVAHDLNNILTPMLMASGVLQGKLADPKDRELMTLLDQGGRRGAAIVQQLLAFSRNLAQDRLPVNPRLIVRDLAQQLRATYPKEITIREVIAEGDDLLEADRSQLQQVFVNLCSNSRDAMPGGGTLTLRVERVNLATATDVAAGEYFVIKVTDTGTGISAENLTRIFTPFFTTKPVGKGTGLGLASVHGIVKAHRGFVRVESQPGQGSTFSVFLPLKKSDTRPPIPATPPSPTPNPPPAVAPTGPSPVPAPAAGILIVDDDAAVLKVTGRLLQRAGYPVFTAAGGVEALQCLRQQRDTVALVITDFSMPDMDGPTLVVKLREISGGLRIIGVSGQNYDHRLPELKAMGFSELLTKPYEWEELIKAVQRYLPSPGH